MKNSQSFTAFSQILKKKKERQNLFECFPNHLQLSGSLNSAIPYHDLPSNLVFNFLLLPIYTVLSCLPKYWRMLVGGEASITQLLLLLLFFSGK